MLYSLYWEKPRLMVPRNFRFEVDERIDAAGSIVQPIDLKSAEEAVKQLGLYWLVLNEPVPEI